MARRGGRGSMLDCIAQWQSVWLGLHITRSIAAGAAETLAEGSECPLPRYCWLVRYDGSLRYHTAMQTLFVAWYNFARKHDPHTLGQRTD